MFFELVNVTGDPGGNSIGLFADDDAPFKNQYPSDKSTSDNFIQKTLRAGTKLVALDPDKVLTLEEKAQGVKLWESRDGKGFFNERGFSMVWYFSWEPLSNGKRGVEITPGQGGAWMDMIGHVKRFWLDKDGKMTYTDPGKPEEPKPEPQEPEIIEVRIVGVSWDKGLILKFEEK